MCSGFKRALLLAAVLPGLGSGASGQPALRVCADPNNMPFSNARTEGFENRIAAPVRIPFSTRGRFVHERIAASESQVRLRATHSSRIS